MKKNVTALSTYSVCTLSIFASLFLCFSCKLSNSQKSASEEKAIVGSGASILWTADVGGVQADNSVFQCWYEAVIVPSQRIAIKKDTGVDTFYKVFGQSLQLVDGALKNYELHKSIRTEDGLDEASNLTNVGVQQS